MAAAGSSGSNPNPWAPYDSYKDCSQGICSIYCPQWCYMIFPPPPPFSLEDESPTDFSPLIIAVIGVLASAFILVSYYTIISKYCRRRRNNDEATIEFHDNHAVNSSDADAGNNNINIGGLDEAVIKSITVVKYKKGDGLVEGTDCSVCLSEFVEDESLRLLPKCSHAFHLPCIDTWFKSHSNCPLCRANIQQTVSLNQYQHTNQTHVLVIHQAAPHVVGDQEAHLVVNHDHHQISHARDDPDQDHQIRQITRSVSMNSSVMCQGPVLVADILRGNEEEEGDDDQMEKSRSKRVLNLVRNTPLAFTRSISTGRFIFTRYASKSGNDSIIPN
ncbi:hypothetical protein QYF36_006436 [Acer negundo]|nr:hypothetical protein QYF36_006436 [Acer negundo]